MDRVYKVYEIMRLSGMEIETLLKYVQLYKEGKDTVLERKRLLEEQKISF